VGRSWLLSGNPPTDREPDAQTSRRLGTGVGERLDIGSSWASVRISQHPAYGVDRHVTSLGKAIGPDRRSRGWGHELHEPEVAPDPSFLVRTPVNWSPQSFNIASTWRSRRRRRPGRPVLQLTSLRQVTCTAQPRWSPDHVKRNEHARYGIGTVSTAYRDVRGNARVCVRFDKFRRNPRVLETGTWVPAATLQPALDESDGSERDEQ
jgi:hypothetical protein